MICRLNFNITFIHTQTLFVEIYKQESLDIRIRLMTLQKFRQQYKQALELTKCRNNKPNNARFKKRKTRYERLLIFRFSSMIIYYR